MHNRVPREAALALKVVFLSRSVEEDAKNAEAGIKIGRIASLALAKGRTTFTLARLVSDSVNGRLLFLLFAVLILGIRTAPYDIPQPNPEIDGTAVGTATNARAGGNDSPIDVSITPVSFPSVSAPPFWIVIARYKLQHWGPDAVDARTVSHFSRHTALPLPYLARGSPIHRGFVDPDLSIGGADCKSCDTHNRSSVWSVTVSSKSSAGSTQLRTSASAPPLGSSCITASICPPVFDL